MFIISQLFYYVSLAVINRLDWNKKLEQIETAYLKKENKKLKDTINEKLLSKNEL